MPGPFTIHLTIMKKKVCIICAILLVSIVQSFSQEEVHSLTFKITVADTLESYFKSEGRLFIFLTTNPNGQPAAKIWPNSSYTGHNFIFAKNYLFWNVKDTLIINDNKDWKVWGRTGKCTFNSIPEGTYYVQILWQQFFDEFATTESGNIRSVKQKVVLNSSKILELKLDWVYEASKPEENAHVKLIHLKSDTLSKWWGKTLYENAVILLPSGYFKNPGIEYPIYYYIGGGASDCMRGAWLMSESNEFADWWMAEDAPQIIIVYLDGMKNRNIYHINSENLGPHGFSLINEFIPYIENQYRGTLSPDTRFIGGCSTGGYGSLALQLFYPEMFNGVFCYDPDPLSFSELFYINLYENENVFYDEFGYPTMLNMLGRVNDPISWKDWVEFENVLGQSGTYIDSDHVMGIWSAIFGPKSDNGLPVPIVDPLTGDIDKKAAMKWSRYDLSKYIADNWDRIGLSLQGKIHISCFVNDYFFLDRAVRVFESTLNELKNPEPNAIIEWIPGKGHCIAHIKGLPHQAVLKQIEEKVYKINDTK
jgi:hypothetical protein